MGVDLSPEESFWVWIMRRNKAEKKERIVRKAQIGRLRIRYSRRRKKELWGRFGGGWNWAIGFEAGGTTLLVHLLISSISFNWRKEEADGEAK